MSVYLNHFCSKIYTNLDIMCFLLLIPLTQFMSCFCAFRNAATNINYQSSITAVAGNGDELVPCVVDATDNRF